MGWHDWVRTVEVEPSLYAADFSRLGEEVEILLRAGVRVFHFDVGDGHFVEPITMGPIVLRSIAPIVHAMDGVVDCHLMVDNPLRHFPQIAEAGGDSVTFHYEAVDDVPATIAAAREHGLQVGVAFNPETEPEDVAKVAGDADIVLCMSIHPGYSGQEFMPEAIERIEADALGVAVVRARAGRRRHRQRERARRLRRRREAHRRRERDLPSRGSAALVSPAGTSTGVNYMKRALELAERGRGKVRDHPLVGAVVVAGDEIVGEGWYEYDAVDHAETVALAQAGERARGATIYVTLEPCAHHGRTPPCADAVAAAGIARVVVGALDPNPKAAGGVARLRAAGVDVEVVDSVEARRQNEAWRTWVALGRPHVTYKAAITLDGRVVVPGRRWVSDEESRRLVHELRASVDAVAVGMGTVRADDPRLDARDVGATQQPRRLAFGHGDAGELELRTGPLEDELRALAQEGVQSLLLEGGPTLATAFLAADLVDKLMLFVAPVVAGSGPRFLGDVAPWR